MVRQLLTTAFVLTAYLSLGATTIVMPTDGALVDKSEAVVEGTVVEVRAVDREGAIWTRTTIEVTSVLKGDVPARISVDEPGGEIEGRRTVVFGAPSFSHGQRVLLFLSDLEGDSARVTDLFAGQFIQQSGAPGIWRRAGVTDGVRILADPSSRVAMPRRADRFEQWLLDRVAGMDREPDYFVDVETERSLADDFSLISEPTVYRWTSFDRGVTAGWRSVGAQTGYKDGGRDAIRTGMASWTGYAAAGIRYRFDGASSVAAGGLSRANGINEIMFEDPLGEIAGTWSPATGGVVGVGGFNATVTGGAWTPPFAADPAHGSATIASTWEITEANLVVQNGVAPSRDIPEFDFTELIAHELGHTLGLGHSADGLALMYYQMTGLGPSLRPDDQLAVRWLYPAGSSPVTAPSPPTGLSARAEGAGAVRLDWTDASSSETGFIVYVAVDGDGYRRVAETEANRTSITVGSLTPGTRYRFVVTATNAAGESAPSNAVEITVESAQPVAAFKVSPLAGVAGLTEFRFTDQSSGPVATREWSFGDGGSSTLANPSHVYGVPGTVQVRLTVRSSAGVESSSTRAITISSPADPPQAAFSFRPSSPSTLDEVEFVDASTGHVQSWNWQFGDGTYSNEQNPRLRFGTPGTYTITLIVSGHGTQSVLSRTLTVSGGSGGAQNVVAAFEIDSGVLVEGEEVRFFDRSTGFPNSWYWQFGDGVFSTRQNPTHVYQRAGTYALLLRAGNEASHASSTTTVRVHPASRVLRLLIPAVADVPGAADSSWRSDLSIFNADSVEREVALTLIPAEGARESRRITLAPRGTQVWGNVLRDLFGRASSSGALLIESAGEERRPELAVSSRTFTRNGAATYGQGVAAVEPGGVSFTLTGVRSDASFRTNIGIVNAGALQRRVTAVARNASGTALATLVYDAPPSSFSQRALGSWFPPAVASSVVTVQFESDGDGVFAYASVVDNRTQDPVFLAAAPDHTASEVQLLPVAASTSGAAGTRWLSEITLFNTDGNENDLAVSLVPMLPAAGRTTTVRILSRETRVVPDAIRTLSGGDGAGAVLLAPGVVASSRTYTLDSSGGSWGQGVPPIPLRTSSRVATSLTGLRHDAQFRTNLGFVNAGDTAADVTIELYDREGDAIDATGARVEAGSLSQWSIGSLFPGLAYGGVFSARITSTGAVTVYASVIDNTSGDPSFFLGR